MPFSSRFRAFLARSAFGGPASGSDGLGIRSGALEWASASQPVVQACLDGLRREFDLDLLILATKAEDEVLKFWISSSTSVDDSTPELQVAKAESARLFGEAATAARWGHYRWMRGRYLWLRGPIGEAQDRYGIVAARRTRLSPLESTILGEICRAVVDFGVKGPRDWPFCQHEMAEKTSALLRFDGRDAVAEVHATWVLSPNAEAQLQGSPPRRVGLARDPSPVMAVARAGAKAARPRCEVVHAGLVRSQSINSGVAVVRVASGELRIGLATTEQSVDPQGFTSVAVAVMSASLKSNDSRNEIYLTPAQIGGQVR